MRGLLTAVGVVGLMAGAPALAQEAPGDLDTYACAFAGDCGGATPVDLEEEDVPTIAAPATRGFRLASPQQTVEASMPAPETRGFRIATGMQPGASARNARTTRLNSATETRASAMRSPRMARAGSRYAAPRADTTAGAVIPRAARADLLLSFQYNSASMTPAAVGRARTFAQALNMDELKGKRFVVEGHTDARGSRGKNMNLSQRRAQAVADFLIAQGVERSRVEVRGVGSAAPLPGLPRNSDAHRRVEAVLLS